MNKWFKLLILALIIISAAIQAKEFSNGPRPVPIATVILQLVLLIVLGGNEIHQGGRGKREADVHARASDGYR